MATQDFYILNVTTKRPEHDCSVEFPHLRCSACGSDVRLEFIHGIHPTLTVEILGICTDCAMIHPQGQISLEYVEVKERVYST